MAHRPAGRAGRLSGRAAVIRCSRASSSRSRPGSGSARPLGRGSPQAPPTRSTPARATSTRPTSPGSCPVSPSRMRSSGGAPASDDPRRHPGDPGGPPIAPTDTMAPIDPASVPRRTLAGGASMPAIGLGTFGSDHVPGRSEWPRPSRAPSELGYRHIDCAAVYGNEHQIGEALERAIARRHAGAMSCGSRPSCGTTGTPRPTWPPRSSARCATCGSTTSTCTSSIGRSRTLMRPGVAVRVARHECPALHPRTLHGDLGARWSSSSSVGLVRHIGTSNMTIPKLRLAAARRAHSAGGERDGAAPAFSAAGAVRVRA